MRPVFIVVLMLTVLCTAAQTEKNKPSKKAPKKTEVPKEEIPPVEELREVMIDTSTTVYPTVQAKIGFDTSAAPSDSLTALIKQLIDITGVKATDAEMAEASLKRSMGPALDNPQTSDMMKKFYDRFMYEIKEGRGARWLENLYIRNYRALFTEDEIKTLIAFYQTPAGRKSLEKTKILLRNVMEDASKIGAYLGEDLMKNIIGEGYK